MEKRFQDKLENSIKKFENKNVKITISGIIESKFYINKLRYEIKDEILVIEDDESYLDIDIDDIENIYLEFTFDGYALLALMIGKSLQIEIQIEIDELYKKLKIA